MHVLEKTIRALSNHDVANEGSFYPHSVQYLDHDVIFMSYDEMQDFLVATGKIAEAFEGSVHQFENIVYKIIPLTHPNADTLRKLFPFTKPVKVLDKKRSFGLGDRLGIAGPGHLETFRQYDAYPMLAQQSIRELTLTNRTYEDVLDAASYAVFKEGYKDGFGADGDHLKKPEEIEYALRLGFTMITLDCSDYIRNDISTMTDQTILSQDVLTDNYKQTYLNQTFYVDGHAITFDELSLKKSILIYKDAIDYATKIYQTYLSNGKSEANFEVSIDETGTPTTPTEHYFVANELTKRGVKLDTMAPRFCGEFQKGVDYVGDIHQFEKELIVHVAIAEHFGYKLSIHSGSDKFSIFKLIGKHTKGHFHVKTAGTNWLEAMRVVALCDPALYRRVHDFALSMFGEASKFYHVTTNLKNIPPLESLDDHELVDLFGNNDARQMIHITYGYILNAKNDQGNYLFKHDLYALWRAHKDVYKAMLVKHIGKHLELLYSEIDQ